MTDKTDKGQYGRFEVEGIKVLTRRDIIRGVPNRWRARYGKPPWSEDGEKQAIQHRLDELDTETCTVEQIAKIIGNSSWTYNDCDHCEEGECEATIHVGEAPDYEARYVSICLPCLADLGRIAAKEIEAREGQDAKQA